MTDSTITVKNIGGRKGLIDISREKFGHLFVVRRAPREEVQEQKRFSKCTSARWICQCKCGTEKMVLGTHLRRGKTMSCGSRECADRPTTLDKMRTVRNTRRIEVEGMS